MRWSFYYKNSKPLSILKTFSIIAVRLGSKYTYDHDLSLIRLGFLRVVFSGWGQFGPPSIFQEEAI